LCACVRCACAHVCARGPVSFFTPPAGGVLVLGRPSDGRCCCCPPPPRVWSQAIPAELAAKYASDIGALFIETSAKDGCNVKELFQKIAAKLPSPDEAAYAEPGVDVGKREKKSKDDGGGCAC
jgi:hypothetical protein